MDPNLHVSVQYRDAVFKKLKLVPENQFCFDCNLKNPSWCSVILGIFICYNCATPHRSMGTHLSFVRSSELDMWSLRQLAFLEQAGNKVVKNFFRSHGVAGAVDYSSQIAERWRNELGDKVNEIYPKGDVGKGEERKDGRSEDGGKGQSVTIPEVIIPDKTVLPESLIEESQQSEKPAPRPIQPVINRSNYKAPVSEVKHRFRKSKAEETPSVAFKPVSFKVQTDEEEFFDPQPLKAPSRASAHESMPIPTPAPHVIQRKPVEKKAISSEDYEAQFTDPKIQKARINQFSGANSISSDMYFGRQTQPENDFNSDKIRDEAARLGNLALDKAAQVIFI